MAYDKNLKKDYNIGHTKKEAVQEVVRETKNVHCLPAQKSWVGVQGPFVFQAVVMVTGKVGTGGGEDGARWSRLGVRLGDLKC